jgi:hypothetical protein
LVQPKKDVADGLHHPLASDHPFAVLPVAALGQWALQDRGGRLLDLQEQRILLVATLEQGDERPGADAPHADHLAGHIDQLEPLQQLTLIVAQGGLVGPELRFEVAFHRRFGEAIGGLEVPRRDHDRRLADDPVPSGDHLGKLRQRLQAVAGACLPRDLLDPLFAPLGLLGGLL